MARFRDFFVQVEQMWQALSSNQPDDAGAAVDAAEPGPQPGPRPATGDRAATAGSNSTGRPAAELGSVDRNGNGDSSGDAARALGEQAGEQAADLGPQRKKRRIMGPSSGP